MGIFKRKLREVKEDAKLPKTRMELFKIVFKEDFSLLVDSSLINFLFSIPLYLDLISVILLLTKLGVSSIETIFPVIFWGGILSIPGFMIRNIGRMGLYGVMKARVHNEGVMLSVTLFKSIKENIGKSIFIGFIKGLGFGYCLISFFYFSLAQGSWLSQGLGIGLGFVVYFILSITSEYFMSMVQIYNLTTFQALRNSISFTIMYLFPNLLYFIVFSVVPLLLSYFITFGFYIHLLLISFLFDGVSILISTLFAHEVYDRIININYHKDYVGKGLYKEKEDN